MIDGLIAKGFKNFIINFAQSPIINSMGLSILIGVIEKTNQIEGKLAFSNLTEVNAETMEIMGLKADIAGETSLALIGFLQPVEQTVEGAAEILKLIATG